MQKVVTFVKAAKLFLQGKKTYISAAIIILTALDKYLTGQQSFSQFFSSVTGLQLDLAVLAATARAAIGRV